MEKHSGISLSKPRTNAVIWALIALGGAAALAGMLRTPSEKEAAFLFGYSIIRLVIAGAAALAVIGFGALAVTELVQPGWWQRITGKMQRFSMAQSRLFGLVLVVFTVFLSIAALLVLAVSPAAQEFVIFKTVLERFGLLLVWAELAILLMFGMIVLNSELKTGWKAFFSPWRLAVLFAIATVIYVVALEFYAKTTWDIRMRTVREFIFLPALVFLVWSFLYQHYQARPWYQAVSRALLLVTLAVCSYTIYRHMAQWMDWRSTPAKVYWQDLAEAYLNGRMYLIRPFATHDLTLYKGNWYVPNPPLPAFILVPFVALFGAANLNMVLFSIACGALNVVLIYLVLEQAARAQFIPTTKAGNLLITAVFALGTPHWFLATMGRMWELSQTLTLTFAALAVICALRRASPWLVGACLGLAVLSRPNIFTLWPFLAGIMLYYARQDQGKIDWKHAFAWAVQSAVPVCLAVAGLLYYNFIRFDNFLDFGYTTINGAAEIVQAVQTYGMFNPHFIPINLRVMFWKLPEFGIGNACLHFSASRDGFSMLVMTPPLLYVLRRFKLNWWTAGAWASILLSIGLLLCYHNTGSNQIGYRYLMDFVLPALLLMAVGMGQRASWVFKVMSAASVVVSAASLIWWFTEWWWC